jgi:hypothetical protein
MISRRCGNGQLNRPAGARDLQLIDGGDGERIRRPGQERQGSDQGGHYSFVHEMSFNRRPANSKKFHGSIVCWMGARVKVLHPGVKPLVSAWHETAGIPAVFPKAKNREDRENIPDASSRHSRFAPAVSQED